MQARLCDVCIVRDKKLRVGYWRFGYRGDRIKLDVCQKHKGTKVSQEEILQIAIGAESGLAALLEEVSK